MISSYIANFSDCLCISEREMVHFIRFVVVRADKMVALIRWESSAILTDLLNMLLTWFKDLVEADFAARRDLDGLSLEETAFGFEVAQQVERGLVAVQLAEGRLVHLVEVGPHLASLGVQLVL